jgi:hypothetical protein
VKRLVAAGPLEIVLSAAVLLLAGCAVQGRAFEKASAPPDNAVIYVYRPYHYGSSLLRPAVTCGEDSARIGPGGYHAFIVPAGSDQILCSVEGSESADQVAIEAHTRVYYIREEFVWGLWSGHPHLNPVDTDRANAEIQSCCVQEP